MSLYGSLFTRIYDPFLALAVRAGMRALRREVLADARGQVVEIGAGTGLNLPLYPTAVEQLVLTDPEPSMADRLRAHASNDARHPQVLPAPADALPLPDASADVVVSTLVLCTVPDPTRALAEVRRVLRPDGRLLLIEHVRDLAEGRLASAQDRLHAPWKAFGYGCHCNRDTLSTLTAAGFTTDELRPARWKRMPPIVAPLVCGPARPAT